MVGLISFLAFGGLVVLKFPSLLSDNTTGLISISVPFVWLAWVWCCPDGIRIFLDVTDNPIVDG